MFATLNSKKYWVNSVSRIPVREFTEAYRTTAQQGRQDRTLVSSWEAGFSGGMGKRRADTSPSNMSWYSTLDTRFPGQVTLGPLRNTDTRHAEMDDSVRGVVNWNGAPHCIGHDASLAAAFDIYSFSGGTWSKVLDSGTGTGTAQLLDIVSHGNLLIYLARRSTTSAPVLNKYDGTSETLIGTGLPATTDDHAVMISVGANLWAISKASATGLTTVSKSTDDGSNFTAPFTFTSNNPPIGKAVYYDQNGNAAIWCATADNLYILDVTNSKSVPLNKGPFFEDTTITNDYGNTCLVVHQGKLYAIGEREVWEYYWSGDTLVEHAIGPFSTTEGFPSTFIGANKLTDGCSMGRWLVVGTQATASVDGAILAYDSFHAEGESGWHTLDSLAGSAANLHVLGFIGTNLHYTIGGNSTRYAIDCDKNPITVSGYTFAASGKLWSPHYTGGLQDINARWLQQVMDAEDLTASNETIVMKYGANYANPTTTGATYTDTVTSLNFGSSLGVSAKTLCLELAFTRAAGTTTNTPKMHPVVTYYEKVYTTRFAFSMDIDLEETSKIPQRGTPDSIEKDLDTVLDSVTQVAFSYGRTEGGTLHTYNVAPIPEWQFQSLTGQDRLPALGEQASGVVRVFLAERL